MPMRLGGPFYVRTKKGDNMTEDIFEAIKQDPQNASYTKNGIDPLYTAPKTAKILIVGQAPGQKAQDTRLFWNDPSGDNLRKWLGVSRQEFYDSGKFAVLPMDFYFPGKGRAGDLPPRKGFAQKWHPQLLAQMPELELIILVGSYAVKHYLKRPTKETLKTTVKNYHDYLPKYFPLVHPSPRNRLWLQKNPWFEKDVIPELQKRVADLLE